MSKKTPLQVPFTLTFGDALRFLLRQSRTRDEILDYFAPGEQGPALAALHELVEIGDALREGNGYKLNPRADASGTMLARHPLTTGPKADAPAKAAAK